MVAFSAASTKRNIFDPLYYVYSLCPFMKTDFSGNKPYDDSTKENVLPGFDAPAVQRSKRRTVLGVLSENELQGRSLDQVSQTRNPAPLLSHVPSRSLSCHVFSLFCLSAGEPVF